MERRALIILLLTLFGVVGVFWFAAPDEPSSGPTEPIVFPPGVDIQGKGLTFLRVSAAGGMQIRAARGYGVRESNEAVLKDVHFVMRNDEGETGTLDADTCVVPSGSNVVYLTGDVMATTQDFDIRTTDVEFDWVREIATTKAPVAVVGPGLAVKGVGASLMWVTQEITIDQDVVATLNPAQLPGDLKHALPGYPEDGR